MIENNLNTTEIVETNEGVTTELVQSKRGTKTLLHTTDSGLSVQTQYILDLWKQNPHIVIGRATQAEVTEWLGIFNSAGKSRHTTSGKRTDITISLNALQRKIESFLRYVKHYIEEEFGFENAKAHYYKFGIEKSSSMYDLGISRDAILMNLKKLIEGITEIGYSERANTALHFGNRYTMSLKHCLPHRKKKKENNPFQPAKKAFTAKKYVKHSKI